MSDRARGWLLAGSLVLLAISVGMLASGHRTFGAWSNLVIAVLNVTYWFHRRPKRSL